MPYETQGRLETFLLPKGAAYVHPTFGSDRGHYSLERMGVGDRGTAGARCATQVCRKSGVRAAVGDIWRVLLEDIVSDIGTRYPRSDLQAEILIVIEDITIDHGGIGINRYSAG